MHRAQYKMAGFCRIHCNGRSFDIPHFTDENYIGVLSQGVFECMGKSGRVNTDFPLRDNAVFIFKEIFNGVFYSDNV